jgi:hypothetical protein
MEERDAGRRIVRRRFISARLAFPEASQTAAPARPRRHARQWRPQVRPPPHRTRNLQPVK